MLSLKKKSFPLCYLGSYYKMTKTYQEVLFRVNELAKKDQRVYLVTIVVVGEAICASVGYLSQKSIKDRFYRVKTVRTVKTE